MADCFDDFRQNFKMILEGEQAVEAAKSDYEAVEHREHKLAKARAGSILNLAPVDKFVNMWLASEVF